MQPTGQADPHRPQEPEGGQTDVVDHPEQAIEQKRNVEGWDGFASEDSVRKDDLDDGEMEGSDTEYIDVSHAEEEDADAVSVYNHFR